MKLEYISARGDTLSLIEGENYKIVNFDNQTAVASNISSVVIGGADGDTVNSIQAQPRTIIFDLRIFQDVEITKRNILSVIKLKQKGKIRWEQNNRIVEIEGVVESIDMPRWNNEVTMQITLHCEQPFWEDIESVFDEINEYIALHYFTDYANDMLYFTEEGIPFGEYDRTRSRLINNAGDVAVGLDIRIDAFSTVTNPIIRSENGKFFGVGYGTGNKKVVMQAGDVILINTGKDMKSVTLNGQNMLGKIKPNSTWLQLEAGDNIFAVDSDEHIVENMNFTLTYKRRYV